MARHWQDRLKAQGGGDLVEKQVPLGAAALLHLAILGTLWPTAAKEAATYGDQVVSVTLVTGVSSGPGKPASSRPPSLETLADRFGAGDVQPVSQQTRMTVPSTRLDDLLGPSGDNSGRASSTSQPPGGSLGRQIDPYASASVVYSGDDQAKATTLSRRANRCLDARIKGGPVRVVVIIDSQGNLVGRPREPQLSKRREDDALAVRAIQACAPYSAASVPGAPRAYEVEVG